jgi:hypothetical protein
MSINTDRRRRWAALATAFGCAALAGVWLPAQAATTTPVALPSGGLSNGDYEVVVGDQATGSLMAFDPATTNWNGAPLWSWKPTSTYFSSTEIADFGLVSDFKRRLTPGGDQRFVVAASRGLIAEMSYPDGARVWAATAEGTNPHSVDLLPDGDVAAAASDGGWIRVYAASAGSTSYAQFSLADAHGVLWDPRIQRLWSFGDTTVGGVLTPTLMALEVYGPASSPKLREDVARRVPLPWSGGADMAHDLYGDEQSPGTLWLSTNNTVYQYDTVTGSFGSLGTAKRSAVKSIGSQPSGQLVQTKPDASRSPAGPCTTDTWCTASVDFFTPSSSGYTLSFSRSRTGAQFYKARVWTPYATAVDQPGRGAVWDRSGSSAATRVDANGAVLDTAAAAGSDGTAHLFTVLPGSGVWERVTTASGWSTSATHLDTNANIIHTAAVADVGGVSHIFSVVANSGVWEKTNSVSGWSSATKVNTNASVSSDAVALSADGVLHLFTVVPGSGVYEQTNSGSGWSTPVQVDSNGSITMVASSPSTADGKLHLFTIVPGSGIWEKTNPGSGWTSANHIVFEQNTANGDSGDTVSMAATQAGGVPQLAVVRNGYGVEAYAAGSGGWSMTAAYTADASALDVYEVGLPDGTLHLGDVLDVS